MYICNLITVVNRHKHKPTLNDFYVGRGSVLGNPFTSLKFVKTKAEFKSETRRDSIKSYVEYLNEKIEKKDKTICDELNRIWQHAKKGNDVNLSCFCVPRPCHATVIKKIIEARL